MRTLAWEGNEFGDFILIASIHLWNQSIENFVVVVTFRVWFRNLANIITDNEALVIDIDLSNNQKLILATFTAQMEIRTLGKVSMTETEISALRAMVDQAREGLCYQRET